MTINKSKVEAVSLEVLSAYVQQVLREDAVLMNTIKDVSNEAIKGSDTIKFGRRGKLTAENHTGDSASYTDQDFEWITDDLKLEKRAGAYVTMTGMADLQSAVAQEPEIIAEASASIVAAIEAGVYAELKKVHTSNEVALATANVLALVDILNARTKMRQANVKFDDNLFLAINPAQEAQILGLPQFVDASQSGMSSVINSNEIGKIYGFRVVVSNVVEPSKVLAYTRSHCAFGIQEQIRFEKGRILKDDKSEYLLQAIWGVKVLDEGKRGLLLENA